METATPSRVLALPTSWFGELFQHLGPAAISMADKLSEPIARDALEILDGEPDPTAEQVAWAVSLSFALRGLGVGHFERWGDALTFVWRDPPALEKSFHDFAAHFLARVVGDLSGVESFGVVIAQHERSLVVLLAGESCCREVRGLVQSGAPFRSILEQLYAEVAA